MSGFGWTEHDQLRAFYDDLGDIDAVIDLGRRCGYSERQVRLIVEGGFVRGTAISWDLLHDTKTGGRTVRQLLDRDSVVIEEPPMLCIGHNYDRVVGEVTTTNITDYGLTIEAHVDRDHVTEVALLLPCGLSAGLCCYPGEDEWIDDVLLRRGASLTEVSLTPKPALKSCTTDRRLYHRSELDDWYDRVRLEQIENRVDGRALDARLRVLGIAA